MADENAQGGLRRVDLSWPAKQAGLERESTHDMETELPIVKVDMGRLGEGPLSGPASRQTMWRCAAAPQARTTSHITRSPWLVMVAG